MLQCGQNIPKILTTFVLLHVESVVYPPIAHFDSLKYDPITLFDPLLTVSSSLNYSGIDPKT
jgi:hypothetical protein